MDESVRAITTDIQAFKNIRTQLFQKESQAREKANVQSEKKGKKQAEEADSESITSNKYFLYFFHLFESVVNNTSNLVEKYSQHLIHQCPKDVRSEIFKNFEPQVQKDSSDPSKETGARNTQGPQSGEQQASQGGPQKPSQEGQADSKQKADKLSNTPLFNNNVDQLVACKKRIDGALQSMQEYISLSRKLSSVKAAAYHR